MSLIKTLLLIIVIGVALYLVEAYVPMSEPVKTVLRVVVIIVLCLFLLSLFGIVPGIRLNW